MRFDRPRVHGAVVDRLWRAASEGRLPHALLFEGQEGTGRFLAAGYFAAGLLCAEGPGPPCGVCGPCKRVASGGERSNHADLFSVDPVREGEERIRIGRIARRGASASDDAGEPSVEEFLDLVPLEGKWRIVIVREAHRMNPAAQNALLKTLEEPRPGTILILETHRGELLLETILSRCVRVRFDPLPLETCRAILSEQGLEPEEAELLARWFDGSPGAAGAWSARGALALQELIASAWKGTLGPHEVAQALWEVDADYPGSTAAAKARARARAFLDLALAVTRDAKLHAATGRLEGLAHGELVHELLAQESLGGEAAIDLRLRGLFRARRDVERNLTPEAVCERAALVLAEPDPLWCSQE